MAAELLGPRRREGLRAILSLASELQPLREGRAAQAEPEQFELVSKLHGPFLLRYARMVDWPDKNLERDLHGFPLVGNLPPAVYSSQPPKREQKMDAVDEEELWRDMQVVKWAGAGPLEAPALRRRKTQRQRRL